MRIEELILEGFKSYPVRTTITGWDSSFNAITGLNGSGKSNILDAICFVLGITNMSAMRAQNQQDLIYKRGQAGITKASVTIVFDNSDIATSPVGFEGTPQITVTRQIAIPNISKYLLNGHKALQQNIQTLFQSVQLNINNPNFLIMQGRITKVLNMRPQEILGMVEEAAGTRMFEERKDKAKKVMTKKERDIKKIESLVKEEIDPKLQTLKQEKQAFLEWQKTVSELERIERVLRAWDWTEHRQRVIKKEAEIKDNEAAQKQANKTMERTKKEIDMAGTQKEQLQKEREKELEKGGKFKQLQEEVAELQKVLVKVSTQIDLKKSTIEDEERRVKDLERSLVEAQRIGEEKRAAVDDLEKDHNKVKEEHAARTTSLGNAEELLQTLLTGLSSKNAGQSGGGYMGQLADAKVRLAQAAAEEEQCKKKLTEAEKELKTLQSRWKDVEREANDGRKTLAHMKTEVDKCRERLRQSGWDADQDMAADVRLREAKDTVRRLTERRDSVKQNLPMLDFNYSAPYPNFDRSKVKGLVASLVSLPQKDYNKSTALEITAGGRLYNVVVENEKIGKDLLQNGQLRKRVTIIPLNKISARRLPNDKVARAKQLAPGKVDLALSLIGYPDEVSNAMAYVFGDTLICADAASAKLVTFSREVGGVKSVTLDGDVYDPSGTLSGGAAPSSSGVLVKVQQLLDAERELGEATGTLHTLEQEEARTRAAKEKGRQLVRDLEIKEHEMKLLEQQVGSSNASKIGDDVEATKKIIADLKEAITNAQQKQKDAKDECRKLERDMEEFKSNKDGKIDELKADVSKQKAALQRHAVKLKTDQKALQTAKLEFEQMEQDLERGQADLADVKKGIDKHHNELIKLEGEKQKHQARHATAAAKLKEELATLEHFENELRELDEAVKLKKAQIANTEVELTKLEHSLQLLQKDRTASVNAVANLEKQYDWILEEHEQFGRSGTQYDFAGLNINAKRERARELEAQQKGLKKKVNPKAAQVWDFVTKQEAETKSRLARVLKDRRKIDTTVAKLDQAKRDALEKTWQKVNNDFGAIFAELLPGNYAKLQPPEGQDLMDGLEVKVRLGSVWKQSLTELSGGQRSLIALSLIMALLQFKPAPMYILDEIDAALDLSHTQHIGQLFKNRFKGSQFIVVSLKEGLFTNANVLFRTRFRDGTSVVERTAHRSTSNLYERSG